MLKNIMYGVVILAALAVTYGQIRAIQNEKQIARMESEQITNQEKQVSQKEIEAQKIIDENKRKQEAEELAKRKKTERDSLVRRYNLLEFEINRLKTEVEKDKGRFFGRILYDTLLAWGARIKDMEQEQSQTLKQMNKKGYKLQEDFEGYRHGTGMGASPPGSGAGRPRQTQ